MFDLNCIADCTHRIESDGYDGIFITFRFPFDDYKVAIIYHTKDLTIWNGHDFSVEITKGEDVHVIPGELIQGIRNHYDCSEVTIYMYPKVNVSKKLQTTPKST